MAHLTGLKIAEGKARAAIYDATEIFVLRVAVEKLGVSHPLVQAHNRIVKAIDNHMAANAPTRAMATGRRGMRVA